MATLLGLWLLAAAANEAAAPVRSDFGVVIDRHVAQSLGRGVLPVGQGTTLVPGLFVTLGRDRVDIFDRPAFSPAAASGEAGAGPCASRCPAEFFAAFQQAWLRLAGESATLGSEIPTTVHFAVDRSAAARTFLSVAYAAAESRPVVPPNLSLVVEVPGRGLQGQPFFLVPPTGLGVQRGAAILGLLVFVDGDGFELRSLDTTVAPTRVASLDEVRAHLVRLKKIHPGKNAVILVPGEGATVDLVAATIAVARPSFERIVLALQPPA